VGGARQAFLKLSLALQFLPPLILIRFACSFKCRHSLRRNEHGYFPLGNPSFFYVGDWEKMEGIYPSPMDARARLCFANGGGMKRGRGDLDPFPQMQAKLPSSKAFPGLKPEKN
jgi:hypothetical protein